MKLSIRMGPAKKWPNAIYLFVYLAAASITHGQAQTQDLYSPTDDVLQLNGETFEPTVFKQDNGVTFVVQFYNTFCGHCQMFAPIYKELATRLKHWTSVVRLAGIDCSKHENVEPCVANNIDGFPTIFVFPPNSKFKNPDDAPLNMRSLLIEWTVDDLEESIVSYLGNLTQTKRTFPKAINAMEPILINDPSHIERIYLKETDSDGFVNDQNGQQDIMFIVESEKSFLGRKLILEYFRIYQKLEIRRILLSNEKLLRHILRVEDFEQLNRNQPLLLRMNSLESETKAQVLVKGEVDHVLPTVDEAERQDYILNRFKSFLDHYYFVELKEITGYDVDVSKDRKLVGKSNGRPSSNDIAVRNKDKQGELEISYLLHDDPVGSKKIFAQDLLKGISYMITHEIRLKGDIKPNEYNTIRNVLTILKKYLPLDKWDPAMSKFVESLRTKLDEERFQYNKNGLTSQQMKDLLDYSGSDEIRIKYNEESWISCYESDRQHKGYTCSLWLLFHTLTVGEYTKSAPVRSKPTLVLTTMRDYITKFLGCTVCSSNFEKETENLESNLKFRNASVLWLWDTHNRINQRLNNERPESQRKPLFQVIYPSQTRCQECYLTGKLDNIGVDGKTLEDIEWNLPNVLDHMTQLYKPDAVVSPTELSLLLRSVRGKVNYDIVDGLQPDLAGPFSADLNSSSAEKWNIQSIFSSSDMSLCLFLYLSCIVIVAIVYFSLNPRWKRTNKTK